MLEFLSILFDLFIPPIERNPEGKIDYAAFLLKVVVRVALLIIIIVIVIAAFVYLPSIINQ
jgi:hypothetical protein